jgi:hypothetical protein
VRGGVRLDVFHRLSGVTERFYVGSLFLFNELRGLPVKVEMLEATNHEQGTRLCVAKGGHTHIQRLVMEACEAILRNAARSASAFSASKVKSPDMMSKV